jgi:ABC-type multidrug transport system ATPase subunit
MVDKVCKSYSGKQVLEEISLSIKKDQIVCLLGNNGAGKTTLINILVGLTNFDKGSISVFGHDVLTDIYEVRRNIRLC